MNVLLVDDHPMLREGIRALFRQHEDVTIVGDARSGEEAVAEARRLRPDIIVMDISMPGLTGVEATRIILQELPGTKIVALTMNRDKHHVQAMFEAGASGYVVKTSASGELLSAIRAIARGETFVSPAAAGALVDGMRRRKTDQPADLTDKLTAREREVLRLLAQGFTSKEIAGRLGVAPSTIDSHRKQIMLKLSARSVAQLTRLAIRAGLIEA
ncbi:MAG: response regulator transcription factor [Polyangiaceae bacterium]